jgi:hypothetical protein
MKIGRHHAYDVVECPIENQFAVDARVKNSRAIQEFSGEERR